MGLTRTTSRLLSWAVVPFALLAGAAGTAHAQQATIAGRVTAAGTGEPLSDSRVILVGTSLFASTNNDGRYTLRNVPAGTFTLRIIRVGYSEQKRSLTITAGQAVTADFQMSQAVVQLAEVVTTATGEQRRVELGNAVANIDAAKVTETAPITNLQDVLAARTPGVTVSTPSQVGGGARVRIRGNSSLNLSNDPIYIIDGIRMTSNTGSTSLFTGGSTPNRANDINPDDIANIEIVKGPSAATLYGTDAANGVIVITTKKGRAGQARWNAWAEGGILQDRSTYPINYTLAGHDPTSGALLIKAGECTLPKVAAGTCVRDSLRTYSVFNDADNTPVGDGNRNKFGTSVSGGSDALRFYLSGEREDEVGTLKLPNNELRRLDSTGVDIPSNVRRPNSQYKYSVRANLGATISPKLDLNFTSSFMHNNTLFATESNATAGIGSQAFGGPGYKDNGIVNCTSGCGTPLNGYRAWTPGYTFQEVNQQRLNRTLTSASADWRPFSFMQNRANIGIDYTSRVDLNLNRNGDGPPVSSNYRTGFKDDYRTGLRNFSWDLGSTNTYNVTTSISTRTTVGAQYVNYQLDQAEAYALGLPPGAQTPNAGATKDANEATTITKTLGGFIEEQVAMRDRLFITGAVRSDQNSAFGTKFQRVVYPKASVSWLLSDESFFPKYDWMNQLRFRAAYGASGVQPGPNDALRYFSGVATNIKGTDVPGLSYSAIGNNYLKPERTAEFEGGFDLHLFNRSNFEITYYSKTTKDALISAIVAPSAGAATSVRENLGSVKNAGLEFMNNDQIVDNGSVGFDITLSASMNDNKLVDLGGVPTQVGTTTRAQAGYPLFGFWARPILGWKDKNGDGILSYNKDTTLNEVFVGDSSIFRGYSVPRYTASVMPGVELLGRKLRLASLIEYKGGNKYYNNTERIRCVSRQNCNGRNNPNASFEEQAMAVATLDHPSKTLDGFFQPGSFVRLREITATYTIPEAFVARFARGRTASLNFAARNLKVWTNYRGIDPEIDRLAGDSSNGPPEEFQTMGLPSYFTLRLNLGF